MPDIKVINLTDRMRKYYKVGKQYDFFVEISRNLAIDGDGNEDNRYEVVCTKADLQKCVIVGLNYFVEPKGLCKECKKIEHRKYSSFCSSECQDNWWLRQKNGYKDWFCIPNRIKCKSYDISDKYFYD